MAATVSKRDAKLQVAKKHKLILQRFRTVIRLVIMHKRWLVDAGEEQFSMNVKKNIAMYLRTELKIGSLTLADKALLRRDHKLRTVEERKLLLTLITGLNCFSKLPPKLRARLVPVVKFICCEPGRRIIKEGQVPYDVYFILSGTVEMSKKVYDSHSRTYVEHVVDVCLPGDCIGDIDLVQNCPRRNTYFAVDQVELLVVYNDDFNEVLRSFFTTQWGYKTTALRSLGYFDFLNEEQTTNACKQAILHQFEPLEQIYFEDKGPASYTYFVISGECMILQCLKMKMTKKNKRKTYQLVGTSRADDEGSLRQQGSSTELWRKLKDRKLSITNLGQSQQSAPQSVDADDDEDDEDDEPGESTLVKQTQYKSVLETVEIQCGLTTKKQMEVEKSIAIDSIKQERDKSKESDDLYLPSLDIPKRPSEEDLGNLTATATELGRFTETQRILTEKEREEEDEFTDETSSELTASSSDKFILSTPKKSLSIEDFTIEDHFIDVGSFADGGIFGLGERIEARIIMARTTVQCLLLPRFWLFEKEQNPGNIWQRKRTMLNNTVPSREALFDDFLKTQKWRKFKSGVIKNILDTIVVNTNHTKVGDIPEIGRIIEGDDDSD